MAQVPVERKPRGKDRSELNVTIMEEIISCLTTTNGKRLRISSIPSWEIECPAPFAHTDGSPRWNPRHVGDKEGGDREMLQ